MNSNAACLTYAVRITYWLLEIRFDVPDVLFFNVSEKRILKGWSFRFNLFCILILLLLWSQEMSDIGTLVPIFLGGYRLGSRGKIKYGKSDFSPSFGLQNSWL